MKKVRSTSELFTHIRNDIRDYKDRSIARLSRATVDNIRAADKDISLEVSETEDGIRIKSAGKADKDTISKRTTIFAETFEKIKIQIPDLFRE